MSETPRLLVVGTVAFDDVETPAGRREGVLGGSATYFSVAASYFTKVGVVGDVGGDFPDGFRRVLQAHGVDLAGLVVKLTGCELSHQISALALDAMGELGMLYQRSAYERERGRWLFQYMFSLGLIIGGGTAQIQKNIISERGLGMPREPKLAAGA